MTPEVFACAAFAALGFFLTGVAVGLAWAERQVEQVERDALTVNVSLDGKVIARETWPMQVGGTPSGREF